MLKFRCPHCNANLKVDEQLAGKQSHCPSCRATLTIPTEGSQNEPMLGAKVERISQSTLPTPSTVSTSETPGIIRRRRFRVLLTTVAASLAALVLGWSLLTTIQSRNALANLSQRVNELETAVADSDKTSFAELRKEVDKLRLRTKELQDKLEQADAAFEAVGEQKREIQASNERLVLLSQQLALLKETVDENREDAVKKSDLLAEFKKQLQAEVQKEVEKPAAEPGEKPMEQRGQEITMRDIVKNMQRAVEAQDNEIQRKRILDSITGRTTTIDGLVKNIRLVDHNTVVTIKSYSRSKIALGSAYSSIFMPMPTSSETIVVTEVTVPEKQADDLKIDQRIKIAIIIETINATLKDKEDLSAEIDHKLGTLQTRKDVDAYMKQVEEDMAELTIWIKAAPTK